MTFTTSPPSGGRKRGSIDWSTSKTTGDSAENPSRPSKASWMPAPGPSWRRADAATSPLSGIWMRRPVGVRGSATTNSSLG